MDRRELLKGIAAASYGGLSSKALYGAQAQPPEAPPVERSQIMPPDDPWPGKKIILAIADPQEWVSAPRAITMMRLRTRWRLLNGLGASRGPGSP